MTAIRQRLLNLCYNRDKKADKRIFLIMIPILKQYLHDRLFKAENSSEGVEVPITNQNDRAIEEELTKSKPLEGKRNIQSYSEVSELIVHFQIQNLLLPASREQKLDQLWKSTMTFMLSKFLERNISSCFPIFSGLS